MQIAKVDRRFFREEAVRIPRENEHFGEQVGILAEVRQLGRGKEIVNVARRPSPRAESS